MIDRDRHVTIQFVTADRKYNIIIPRRKFPFVQTGPLTFGCFLLLLNLTNAKILLHLLVVRDVRVDLLVAVVDLDNERASVTHSIEKRHSDESHVYQPALVVYQRELHPLRILILLGLKT